MGYWCCEGVAVLAMKLCCQGCLLDATLDQTLLRLLGQHLTCGSHHICLSVIPASCYYHVRSHINHTFHHFVEDSESANSIITSHIKIYLLCDIFSISIFLNFLPYCVLTSGLVYIQATKHTLTHGITESLYSVSPLP